MPSADVLLQVEDLCVTFGGGAPVRAVRNVSFGIPAGETLALVGESGSGKTVTGLSLAGLIDPPGIVSAARMRFGSTDLRRLSAEQLCRMRGADIAMVFQEPMTALNPVMTVGEQIGEIVRAHRPGCPAPEIRRMTEETLAAVELSAPELVMSRYPHMLSGGERQRVLIAMAVILSPRLIVLDEPTTALDVTVQAQVLSLLSRLQHERHIAYLFITHNFGIVRQVAAAVAVMYAGKIVECGRTEGVMDDPRHPYTAGLISCIPSVDRVPRRLVTVPGECGGAREENGCAFQARCGRATGRCSEEPPLTEKRKGHWHACWYG